MIMVGNTRHYLQSRASDQVSGKSEAPYVRPWIDLIDTNAVY